MAQKVQVVLVDDIDGGAADETITFSLDGVTYEIDLSSAHANELRDAMARWVGAGRRVGGRAQRAARRGSASSRSRSTSTQIRDWGRENGYTVNERGRISAELREAYEKATAR
ncbi:Lsr2 family protein [Actinotalea sp.]|uniref:histone-like nucleoid-structuring protein Lsr2 n=1 Tax=Actinotalea sp. TaxID=1872145 RepID=UPI0035646BD2